MKKYIKHIEFLLDEIEKDFIKLLGSKQRKVYEDLDLPLEDLVSCTYLTEKKKAKHLHRLACELDCIRTRVLLYLELSENGKILLDFTEENT